MDQIQNEPKKSYAWVWVIIIAVILIGGYFIYQNNFAKKESPKETTSETNSTPRETKTLAESWQRNSEIVFDNITSTDTHKISDNLFRMYMNKEGNIVYTESTDGKTWGSTQSTGISEDAGKFISNPAVLKVADGNWIMLYEQQPQQKKGQTPGPSSAVNQRNLYLATSLDGKTFAKAGISIDSSVADNYFASVPDLILLPDGKIRVYYVCGGESICSQVSADNGKTWAKESGVRLAEMAVDPDVKTKTENGKTKWIMYYSILDPQKNGLYKAVSSDGLAWTKLDGQVVEKTGNNAIVDPDVVEISPNNFVMYFGESSGASSVGGDQINLYGAIYNGDIF